MQLLLIAFDDPDQYRLPVTRWTAAALAAAPSPRIACLLQPPEPAAFL